MTHIAKAAGLFCLAALVLKLRAVFADNSFEAVLWGGNRVVFIIFCGLAAGFEDISGRAVFLCIIQTDIHFYLCAGKKSAWCMGQVVSLFSLRVLVGYGFQCLCAAFFGSLGDFARGFSAGLVWAGRYPAGGGADYIFGCTVYGFYGEIGFLLSLS